MLLRLGGFQLLLGPRRLTRLVGGAFDRDWLSNHLTFPQVLDVEVDLRCLFVLLGDGSRLAGLHARHGVVLADVDDDIAVEGVLEEAVLPELQFHKGLLGCGSEGVVPGGYVSLSFERSCFKFVVAYSNPAVQVLG